jgi:hypothetical protein
MSHNEKQKSLFPQCGEGLFLRLPLRMGSKLITGANDVPNALSTKEIKKRTKNTHTCSRMWIKMMIIVDILKTSVNKYVYIVDCSFYMWINSVLYCGITLLSLHLQSS